MVSERLSLFVPLNPWWKTKEVPSSWIGLLRKKYLDEMLKWINDDFILVISGIRRSGKTTLIYQVLDRLMKDKRFEPQNILFVNCDDVKVRESFKYLIDIAEVFDSLGNNKKIIVLDEVQYYEKWEQQCKNLYDTYKGKMKILISGSSATLRTSEDLHFLTGRMIPIGVSPFGFDEFIQAKKISIPKMANDFEKDYKNIVQLGLDSLVQEYLEYGGFPEIIFAEVDKRNQIAKEYLDEVIYKDIVKLWEIKDIKNLEKIALFLMQNVGQRFSYRKIADAIGENKNTVQNYLHYIDESYLISLVEYYAKSTAQRFRKEKKIALVDPVFHTNRFGIVNIGSLAENAVHIQLAKSRLHVFYWKNTYEVDFVIENAKGEITPIEVKYQNEINAGDFKGLRSFFKHFEKVKYGIMVTKNKFETVKTKDGKVIRLVPLWLFLLSF
ncbi:MAG: ATP-binding protein [Candidatus Micrarchaeota archaeon]